MADLDQSHLAQERNRYETAWTGEGQHEGLLLSIEDLLCHLESRRFYFPLSTQVIAIIR